MAAAQNASRRSPPTTGDSDSVDTTDQEAISAIGRWLHLAVDRVMVDIREPVLHNLDDEMITSLEDAIEKLLASSAS